MEAIGQLTGGVAHDFNNLLMIVSGHAQLLHMRAQDSKVLRGLDAILTATRRGEALTRQLLSFARRQRLSPTVIALQNQVRVIADMLSSSLRGDIQFECDVPADIWPVRADETEFELALVNVTVNARDAMPEGGTLKLAARNVSLTPSSQPNLGLTGDFVAVTVSDTGSGMPASVLSHVFEPFFTTKEHGKGTGLGLSQVYGFARQSGGTVTIDSREGEGTAVTIYLPRSTEAAEERKPQQIVPGRHREGTILLVEDNPDVMETTAIMLEELGYRAVRAGNADEALALLDAGENVALVFSDIVMPGPMNGLAMAHEIKERFPEVPVLLTSGYSEAAESVGSAFAILRKPFDFHALDAAVRDALAGTSPG
jgi:two-component system NtrC family sensor kinase